LPDFDPKTNGHKAPPPPPPPRRGGGILLLALVSAFTGLNLLIGGAIGAIVGSATNSGDVVPALVALGAGLGGAVGVYFGVRVCVRLGGSSGVASVRWLTAWGLAGLLGSIALAATVASPLTPIIAILLPGIAAALGDRYATKKHLAATGQGKPKPKLREQEEASE
jgi:hypothetical protein